MGAADTVLSGVLGPTDGPFDFCMCNPPFFASAEEIDRAPSHAAPCAGTAGEMLADGGEVGFVARMVADSTVLKGRVRWYVESIR